MALSPGFTVAGTLTVLAAAGRRGWVDCPAIVAKLKYETNSRMTDALAAAWEAGRRQEF